MGLALFLLFIVLPLIELAVIIQVGSLIGVLPTFAIMVLSALIGSWLCKREGLGVLRRINASLDAGRVPTTELADGALIVLAGCMMITPGFVTDLAGILLLLPPVRALVPQRPEARGTVQPLADCRSVSFDASTSAGRIPLAFLWEFGDGSSAGAPVIAHRYDRPGRYTARLSVMEPGDRPGRGDQIDRRGCRTTVDKPPHFNKECTGHLPLLCCAIGCLSKLGRRHEEIGQLRLRCESGKEMQHI